jgi:hypothetical protein
MCKGRTPSTSTAVLLLFAQLVGLLHLLLVPHTQCAAHGEMVEGDAHADHAATVEGEGPSVGAATLAEDDDHCLSLALASTSIGCEPSDPGLVLPIDAHQTVHRDAGSLGCGSALFLLAPKTSPPV